LAGVVAIAVFDRVDHRLPDRHAHPMARVVVETHTSAEVLGDNLHEVEHLECAGEFEMHVLAGWCRHLWVNGPWREDTIGCAAARPSTSLRTASTMLGGSPVS